MAGVSGRSKTKAGPRRAWTPAEKLRVVVAAEQLGDEQLGALLRREGLHERDLRAFREEALAGLSAKPAKRGPTPEEKRIQELERELHRKDLRERVRRGLPGRPRARSAMDIAAPPHGS
jgi:transposase-like protein